MNEITRIDNRRFNFMAERSSRFEGTCHFCGLHTFASKSGMIDGFFGAHQGTDGGTPSCPGKRVAS